MPRYLIAAVLLLLASPALAVPVTYGFESGDITVQARRSDDNSLVFDETIVFDGVDVTWDPDGTPTIFGTGDLTDFEFTVAQQGPYTLLQPYGAHDQVTVESIVLTPDVGYSTQISSPIGPGLWSIVAGEVDVQAYYSATDTGGNPPVNNVLAPIVGTNNLNGTVAVNGGALTITLNNVLMGTLPGAPFGESADLNITGNITWFGSEAAAVPEPSTALMLGLGLVGMAWNRSSRGAAKRD